MTVDSLGSNLRSLQKSKLSDLYSLIKHPLWEKNKKENTVLPLTEFLMAIGQVHYNAAHKHPPFGWEKSPTYEVDSTPTCNLDAMLRHLLRIIMADEQDDTESMLPHSYHIACRWQMFVTSTLRLKTPLSKNGIANLDQVNPVIVVPKLGETQERDAGNGMCLMEPVWCKDTSLWLRYVTPESISVLMRIAPEVVDECLVDYWEMGKTVNMTHHRAMFSAVLTALQHFADYQYDKDPSTIIWNDIDCVTAHSLAYFTIWQRTMCNPPKKSTR